MSGAQDTAHRGGGESVLDVLLIAMVAWFAVMGYSLGAMRTLIYVSGVIGGAYMAEMGIPILRALHLDPFLSRQAGAWFRRVMEPYAPAQRTGAGLAAALETGGVMRTWVHAVYEQALLVAYVGAVVFGFLMALRSYETIWPRGMEHESSRKIGILFGLFVGLYAVAFALHGLVALAWAERNPELRVWLYRSVLAHIWIRFIARGII